ncbi:MAG TPA: ATP-binding protein [Gallionellaceae bacterium]|nr:ATP-binding protein [Gallionellaceae bacterium]
MVRRKTSYYVNILLIALELPLIAYASHVARGLVPSAIGQYLALDILYCLPVIQAARLAAIRATAGLRSPTAAIVGITAALACSVTELATAWPDFPVEAFLLNTYSRGIVFTVITSVLAKLWRERKHARRFRTLAAGTSEGVAVTANGMLVDVNDQLARMLGYGRREMLGQAIEDFVPGPQRARVSAADADSHIEHDMVRKDGSRMIVEARTQLVNDGEEDFTVSAIRDITERRRYEKELISAKAEAERANAEKSRFLAAASHDLRQPLTALSLYTGVLEDRLDAENLTIVTKMAECVAGLSDLLTKLLDLSKLDAAVEAPHVRDFAVDDILDALLVAHDPEAELKGLKLRRVRSGLIARTDPVLFQRILGNLLSNAIRYTTHGGVLIGSRRRQGKAWIEFWDTGIGIAPDKTKEIFEPFRQLNDDARTRGSGLGLAIVAGTARLLGLKIRVQSRPGRGSMFAVEIPRGTQAGATVSAAPADHISGLRVALVDDNPMALNALACAMENVGHEVVTAINGHTLLAQLGTARPDILVCDYRLAGAETGYEVITATRTAFGEALPAIILTGDTDPELMRSMAGKGIDVQYKPVIFKDLQAHIERLLGGGTAAAAESA